MRPDHDAGARIPTRPCIRGGDSLPAHFRDGGGQDGNVDRPRPDHRPGHRHRPQRRQGRTQPGSAAALGGCLRPAARGCRRRYHDLLVQPRRRRPARNGDLLRRPDDAGKQQAPQGSAARPLQGRGQQRLRAGAAGGGARARDHGDPRQHHVLRSRQPAVDAYAPRNAEQAGDAGRAIARHARRR